MSKRKPTNMRSRKLSANLESEKESMANGYKLVSESGSNAIIEGDGRLFKMSLGWIRPKLESSETTSALPAKDWEDYPKQIANNERSRQISDPSSSSTDANVRKPLAECNNLSGYYI